MDADIGYEHKCIVEAFADVVDWLLDGPDPGPCGPALPSSARRRRGIVHFYNSDGFPVAWRLRVFLLYKAATPLHFTPSKVAQLGRRSGGLQDPILAACHLTSAAGED